MATSAQPPTLRYHESEILLGVLALLELVGSDSVMAHWDRLETEAIGVVWRPRDLANRRRLPRSQSKAFAAARASLETSGLIVSVRGGWAAARVTHIRPTQTALDLASKLTSGGADLAAIAAGLRKCEWGAELARHAEKLAAKFKTFETK